MLPTIADGPGKSSCDVGGEATELEDHNGALPGGSFGGDRQGTT
jgi:hypothetical protein